MKLEFKIMKTNRIIILLCACVFIISSCHDDLDIVQTSKLSASSMWIEEGDATAAMYGAHQLCRSAFNQGLAFWGEYRDGLWGSGASGLTKPFRDEVYQGIMDNTNTYADWKNIYTTINMANLILKYTPGISFNSEDDKNEVLANAYFIRAFCYYWIARIWGDAPLVLDGYESSSQDFYPDRTPVSQIFEQVESDIEMAVDLIPADISERSTASPAAINMLKADYNLWMYKVEEGGTSYLSAASDAIDAVLSNTSYELESNYSAIFDVNTESGSEVIYAWKYTQDEYTGGYPEDYLLSTASASSEYQFNPVAVGPNKQWCFYTDDYISVLTDVANDTRLATNYQSFYDDGKNKTLYWTNKYKGSWLNSTSVLDADMVVYRLADAYLMDAEIKAETNIPVAVASINKVVERAYGVENYYSTDISADEFKNILVKERMKEFPAEGRLWWDFIRLGVVFDVNPYLAGREDEPNILLWPISDNSINDNPDLEQTEGWE